VSRERDLTLLRAPGGISQRLKSPLITVRPPSGLTIGAPAQV